MEKVIFKSDPCSTPWNLSACMLGYYSTNGLDILPCPAGLYFLRYGRGWHQSERVDRWGHGLEKGLSLPILYTRNPGVATDSSHIDEMLIQAI